MIGQYALKGTSMSWFSTGFEEAEKMAQSQSRLRRRNRNFWVKPGEEAIIRFLKPARDSLNYKRAFVPWVKGQKLYTSPGTAPDPLVEAGLSLQAAFAWPILDRRKFSFEVEEDGKKVQKEVGPRFLYFADGQMVRKALIALENTMRKDLNEERAEEGLDPVSGDEYNITSFDIRISKAEKGWNLTGVRGGKPKPLSSDDKEIIEKYTFDLSEELKPLPVAELATVVAKPGGEEAAGKEDEGASSYSYGEDDSNSDEPEFFS